MGDAHEMVVDDVGEVIGGHAVLLDEDHVVHGLRVLEGHVSENHVAVAGLALGGGVHADGVRNAGGLLRGDLVGRKVQAVLVILPGAAGGFHFGFALFDLFLGAEAVIGVAGLNELLGVGEIGGFALGLDIGADRAADVGAFVPVQATGAEGVVNNLGGAFDVALLVGILNTQDKLAVVLLGEQIGIEGGTDAAQVHKARG